MKKYYYWNSDEHYLCIERGRSKEFESILDNDIENGLRILEKWQDFPFKMEKRKKRVSDFPFLALLFLAISERAYECLHPILDTCAEIVPLNIANSDLVYYGVNVFKIYDVDLRRSNISRFLFYDKKRKENYYSGYCIDTFAFPGDQLPDVPLFRLNGYSNFYISEEFREIVLENKLTGLIFDDELEYRTGPGPGKCVDDEGNPAPHPLDDIKTV